MKVKSTLAVLLIITLAISCSKEPEANSPVNVYAIKSVVSGNGQLNDRFIYNHKGNIDESQGLYFCNKFIYDHDGRLEIQEIAADVNLASSTYHQRTELMTSENSTFNARYIYEYDDEGKLKTIKCFFTKNGSLEYTSKNSFEYDGDKIIRRNLHTPNGAVTQYNVFEYDGKGNVAKDKYYSYQSNATTATLISETSYKYDNKNNPFKIYHQLGLPGLYTNNNNIVETNSISYLDTPGLDKNTSSYSSYEYNAEDYPVKVISENSVYEYNY